MSDGRVREAGRLLANQTDPPPAIRDGFADQAVVRVEEDVRRHLSEQSFREATDAVGRVLDEAAVVNLLKADHLKKLRALQSEVFREHDHHLYLLFRQAPSLSRADQYLESAPLKKMEVEVKAYRNYLLVTRGELPLTLRLNMIEWGNAWDRDTDYRVDLNGKTIMEGKVRANDNTVSKDVASAEIHFKLDEGVKLGLHVMHSGYVKTTNYGDPTWEGSVKNLREI